MLLLSRCSAFEAFCAQRRANHLTKLDEWQEVLRDPIVVGKKLAQCSVGADYLKPTMIAGTIETDFEPECKHEATWFREVPSSKWIWRPRPPLRGKLRALKAESWTPKMFEARASYDDEYLTRAAAEYLSEKN